MKENPTLMALTRVMVSILVFLILILTGIRLLLSETFVRFEYNQQTFPPDRYGMTKEERLMYAPLALEFLLNGAAPSFLGDLQFEDGSVLFNQRELSHMVDVQVLTQIFLKVWYISGLILLVIWILAWRGRWLEQFRQMVSRGGLNTIIAIGTLIFVLLLSFDLVFVGFHRIFFAGDSWLFLYSDTLIRLFPEKFWQDAFILVGLFSLFGGLVLWRRLRIRKTK